MKMMKTKNWYIEIQEDYSWIDFLEHVANTLSENPGILDDIIQAFFFVFILLWEVIKNSFNKDEDNQEQSKDSKGKGKATIEQQEQWEREAKRGLGYSGGNDSEDDDNDEDEKNERIKADEMLAKLIQSEFDQEQMVSYDSDGGYSINSLSSYSILSSAIGENDDNDSANKKLDILELDEKLRAEKRELDKYTSSFPVEKEDSKDFKKRKFDDDGDPGSSYKHSKREKSEKDQDF